MRYWKDSIKYNNNIPEIYLIWEKNSFLTQIIDEMFQIIHNNNFDKIITVESKGIILAAPLSVLLKKPLIIVQKKWNLPNEHNNKLEIKIDGWNKIKTTLYLNKSNIPENEDYLFVDDIIHNGTSLNACKKLLNETKNNITKSICISNLSKELNNIISLI